MKNSAMLKIIVLAALLFTFLQCIYVSGVHRDEGRTVRQEQKIPAPALPAL